MWTFVVNELRRKGMLYLIIGSFIFFTGMYILLDYFNGGYYLMVKNYGIYLVILNMIVNMVMSFISALMISISTVYFKQSGKEGKGTAFTGLSVIFGILTYGCTPCVIAFFGSIGITFSVMVLPLAGFPYKLISLFIVVIGFFWLKYEIKHAKCKIKDY
ncbi:hypothetical protein KHQ81_07975 [Mycoplasmatota bacterium]|nr:hypothetical protein KHQ81_07975 [Mycoplasmatota bacterium]